MKNKSYINNINRKINVNKTSKRYYFAVWETSLNVDMGWNSSLVTIYSFGGGGGGGGVWHKNIYQLCRKFTSRNYLDAVFIEFPNIAHSELSVVFYFRRLTKVINTFAYIVSYIIITCYARCLLKVVFV